MNPGRNPFDFVEAALNGDRAEVARLRVQGWDIDGDAEEGRTPLALVAERGDAGAIWVLLRAGANPEIPDAEGRTPLHHAAGSGVSAAVATLLKAKVKVDPVDHEGRTPLDMAVVDSEPDTEAPDIVHALFKAGANLNPGILHRALGPDEPSPETLALLLHFGADPNERDDQGWTPLMLATLPGDTDIVRMLLLYRADPNAFSDDGDAALNIAREEGYGYIEAQLVGAGAKPIDPARHTLETAILWGDVESVYRLTEGPPIDGDEARRLFFLAIERWGKPEILARLLDLGVSPNAIRPTETFAVSALVWAAMVEKVDVLRFLMGAGAAPGEDAGALMVEAAAQDSREMLDLLLAAGAPVDAKGEEGDTALIVAARLGHLETIHFLFLHGANPNLPNDQGETPLHAAIKDLRNPWELTDLLLQSGADIDAVDHEGRTVLMNAVAARPPEEVQRFLALNPNVHARDNEGKTALDYITPEETPDQFEIADLLRDAGARPGNPS
ncbi:MAG: ankyrin repeat domain-containing protein [Fimbriimonas sp.]